MPPPSAVTLASGPTENTAGAPSAMTVMPNVVRVPSPVINAEAPQPSPQMFTPFATVFLPMSLILKSSPILLVLIAEPEKLLSVSVLVSGS